MSIKEIFHAVFTLIKAFSTHVKYFMTPTKAELEAVSVAFADEFDIKDDDLELKI